MSDFLKAILEKVFSWPLAIIVLAIIFKEPIAGLLGRLDRLKGPGIELSAPAETAALQVVAEKTSANEDALIGDTGAQRTQAIAEDIGSRREAVRAFGGSSHVVLLSIVAIEQELVQLEMPLADQDTSRVLVRQLAVTQLLYRFEKLYRLIFGSQLVAMQRLNEAASYSEIEVRAFYERAQAEYPVFYSDYPFEMWISFLVQQQVVALENGSYGISFFGREFLSWMVINGLGSKAF